MTWAILSQAFALVNRSVRFHPLTHQPLSFGVDRLVMLSLNGRLSVADAQIILVPAERFERHLSRQAEVAFDIEVDRASARDDLTAPGCRRWMNDRTPRGIVQKLFRGLLQPVAIRLAASDLCCGLLGEEGPFQFVVAGSVLEQLIDRWRMVVNRPRLDSDDPLLAV